LLGTAPLVHQGFLKTYTKNGFHDRLLAKIEHILNRCQAPLDSSSSETEPHQPRPPIKVMLTGHSLGGALAVLCAYDIATRTPCAAFDVDISCYTFGAPRVGNHAWAREYNSKISETWQLINSDDVVTRAGKFFFLFKHVGNRVLLNRRGDLVVRPSFVEYSIRRSPGGSVKDHYLTSYERAVVAVLAAQFGRKAYDVDAKEELARALSHSLGTKTLLRRAGLTLEDVQGLQEGKAQLTRQKSEKYEKKKKAMAGAGAAAAGEEKETGLMLKARIKQWWDSVESTCLGRHELEPIVAKEEVSVPHSTAERSVEAAPTAAEMEAAERGDGGVAEESAVVEGEQMEVRQQAESGLLHCREMCSRMGGPKQRGERCSFKKRGQKGIGGDGEGSVSGDGSQPP
jgi:hypothetical protein